MIVSIYEEEDELVRKTHLDQALRILGGIIEKRLDPIPEAAGDNDESLCVCIFRWKST